MPSSYKRLGDYIHKVENRNRDLNVSKLVGLSMTKEFRVSTSNIVGTDMSVYKIVNKWQFSCDFMSVIRVHKFPVVLKTDDEPVLVSPAYTVFEVNDENELNPEYLMMWFRRSEFDRYADFKCDSAIRGGFDWDALCDCMLPIPSLEKQKEIVKEYNTIQNRIALNNQLISKLEETAQAIYKQWFVDFEFPHHLCHAELVSASPSSHLGYKSGGGKMVWCEELEKEIPEGWELGDLDDVIENFISKRGKSKSTMNLNDFSQEYKFPVISAMNVSQGKIVKLNTIPYINKIEFDEWMNVKLRVDDVIMTSEAPMGELYYLAINHEFALSQRLYALRTNKDILSGWYLYQWLNLPFTKNELETRYSGTTVFGIKLSELKKLSILIPPKKIITEFDKITLSTSNLVELKNNENKKLEELKELLLAKMTRVISETHVLN
jgi:type I restriction enzyme S subunit